MISTVLKSVISRAVVNEFCWRAMDKTIIKAVNYAVRERTRCVGYWQYRDLVRDALKTICPDYRVKHGPFAGMQFPQDTPIDGVFFPQILGSYESELHPLFNSIRDRRYSDVINVGCAGGYFSVGAALLFPNAAVHAYDIDQSALSRCQKLATLNGVSSRITYGGTCNQETLRASKIEGRGLVISDCEGFEEQLFTEKSIAALSGCDLIIETHDFLNLEITPTLRERFSKTHTIEIIEGLSDVRKVRSLDFDELLSFPPDTRMKLVSEHRPCVQDWIWAQPK